LGAGLVVDWHPTGGVLRGKKKNILLCIFEVIWFGFLRFSTRLVV